MGDGHTLKCSKGFYACVCVCCVCVCLKGWADLKHIVEMYVFLAFQAGHVSNKKDLQNDRFPFWLSFKGALTGNRQRNQTFFWGSSKPFGFRFKPPPTPKRNFFSGYHVDPLLKKEVFTMGKNRLSQKYPEKGGYFE